MSSMNAIGLYIHVPFCRRRCSYCDFTTDVVGQEQWDPYVEAVIRELNHWSHWLEDRSLSSIYFGGGTPSLLGDRRIAKILAAIREGFQPEKNCEISLEANPETVSLEFLKGLKSAGVNRLSMGVQTFHRLHLQILNRTHDETLIEQAVRWIRKAGIENLSLDFIYGIPGQSLDDWQQDLGKAVALEPEHLSTYELILEPWTPLGKQVQTGHCQLPEEETVIAMYEWAEYDLPKQGYEHYEISNFARPGKRCIHNLNTWRQGEYLGVGLAAHSHLKGQRFRNTRTLESYLNQPFEGQFEEAPGHYDLHRLSLEEKWSEAIILGLRTTDGVETRALENRLESSIPEEMEQILHYYTQQGVLLFEQGKFLFSPQGRLISNQVFAELVV